MKVIAGPEKKSRVVPEHARKLTAYHEAGHAVVIRHLETQDPVHQITIIPRGPAGGMTISLPEEDKMYQSRRELPERICALLGGRVAEELENPFSVTVFLVPEGAEGAVPLGWELDKAAWAALRGDTVEVHLPPEKLLILQ